MLASIYDILAFGGVFASIFIGAHMAHNFLKEMDYNYRKYGSKNKSNQKTK